MAERVEYVEIEVERCALVYGQSPCTAEVGTTGSTKCYNTFPTCQDRSNYSPEDYDEVLRFAKPSPALPRDIETVANNIASISYTPATVRLDGELGERASLQVTFRDHLASDVDDPYIDDRTYTLADSFDRGTYWGKFRARFFPMRGQTMRYYRGFSDQTLAEMEKRTFLIEDIDGPRPDGTFRITAKDVLKRLDGDRAQAPLLSGGFILSDISDTSTSVTLGPSGIGDAEYPASGLIAIGGEEIVSFTRSGDVLTITRAQENTEAVEHDANSRAQLVLQYTSQTADAIIEDLLTTYANVDPTAIPSAAWASEVSTFISSVYNATIPEPTSVKDLVTEVLKSVGLALWYDDLDAELKLRVLRQVPAQEVLLDENRLLADTFSVKEQYNQRVSQMWTYFAQNNPLVNRTDPENYFSTVASIDADSEALFNDAAFEKRFSRWISLGGRLIAQELNDRVLSQFSTPPRRFRFALHAGPDEVVPKMGQVYDLKFRTLQDSTGARSTAPVFITRVAPKWGRVECEAEEFLFTPIDTEAFIDRVIFIDGDALNVNLADIHDALFPVVTEDDITGSDPVTITLIVSEGAALGSLTAIKPGLTVPSGRFPTGTDITVEVRGGIYGHGGNGQDPLKSPTDPDIDGGDALKVEIPITLVLDVGSGLIYAGGGGGASGKVKSSAGPPFGGNTYGGSGGAGFTVGAKGRAVDDSNNGVTSLAFDGTRSAGGITGADLSGDGGDPGQDGKSPTNSDVDEVEPAGSGGVAIDGVSNVTKVGTGDIIGAEIN